MLRSQVSSNDGRSTCQQIGRIELGSSRKTNQILVCPLLNQEPQNYPHLEKKSKQGKGVHGLENIRESMLKAVPGCLGEVKEVFE